MQGENEVLGNSDATGAVSADSEIPGGLATEPVPAGELRLLKAQRQGVVRVACDLDAMLPQDHPAREICAIVETLDMSAFEAKIRARGSNPGRPAIDPRILVSLWIHATYEGVSEARKLDRLCRLHVAYLWLCGGVSVDYHVLADFRTNHEEALKRIFTQVLEKLQQQDLVDLQRTSQDGMRVRASAGAASFPREPTLRKHLEQARQEVREAQERTEPEEPKDPRSDAAQQRAAREREERVERALEELPKVRDCKETEKEKAQARVSTTDPEARVMKMADGGFRPAYNVQFQVGVGKARAIVGVEVSQSGSDQGQMEAMLDQFQQRFGTLPEDHLVDGGYSRKENIEHAAARGVTLYTPVHKSPKADVNPHEPKPRDSEAVATWRQRMGTPEAKEIYKQRCSTVETVNADAREHRGLRRFVVRGVKKVRCLVLWFAITYNLHRLVAMGAVA